MPNIKEEIENGGNVVVLSLSETLKPHQPVTSVVRCIKKETGDESTPCVCDECRGKVFIKEDFNETDQSKIKEEEEEEELSRPSTPTGYRIMIWTDEDDEDEDSAGEKDESDNALAVQLNPGMAEQQHKHRLFVCPDCSRQFRSNYLLRQHIRTHTGERPFKCDKCGYRFSLKVNLKKKHQIIHTGEHPFVCDHCRKRFIRADNLKQHLITHSDDRPFACTECDYRCRFKAHLKTHMLTHGDERPFACDQCDYRSSMKGNLKQHQMIHTGERPFVCSVCSKGFRLKQPLKRHMERLHPVSGSSGNESQPQVEANDGQKQSSDLNFQSYDIETGNVKHQPSANTTQLNPTKIKQVMCIKKEPLEEGQNVKDDPCRCNKCLGLEFIKGDPYADDEEIGD